ncbi:hypothetical protein Q6375_13025 [Clostridium septicum]|uniref:hypothetical protein n=1 Tax=Clostridium septicum TaxID=1504 RepID=UPI00272E8EAF|nr:hypothetical protein [Clostridium septicum]WLF68891.1 hypothetical protein Q6375_13025 [Clostridium septicum]
MNNKRKILFHEIKKVFKSPIVLVVFAIFLGVDLFIVFKNYGFRDHLKVLNTIIDEVGYEINDKMMDNFKVYYENRFKDTMDMIKKVEGKSYSSMGEHLRAIEYNLYDVRYTKEEKRICLTGK